MTPRTKTPKLPPLTDLEALSMKGDKSMEILIPLALLAVWLILQTWVLPRFGVKT